MFGLTSAVTLSAPAETSPSAAVQDSPAMTVAHEPPVAPPVSAAVSSVAVGSAPTAAALQPADGEVVAVALSIVKPKPITLTTGELYQALARSPWPKELWSEVVRIASCESKYGAVMDYRAEGDSGRALGVLQVRVDAHPDLARDYDLFTVEGALAASWVIYQRAGYSFRPWSCY